MPTHADIHNFEEMEIYLIEVADETHDRDSNLVISSTVPADKTDNPDVDIHAEANEHKQRKTN